MLAFSEILKSQMHKQKKKKKRLRDKIAEKLTDIGLIIISIYIALAVEGWAEKRHEHKRLIQYYKNFNNEIKQDITDLKKEQADAESHLKFCNRQFQLIANNGPSDSVLFYLGRMVNSSLFNSSNMISYQSMLASGDMKLIEDLEMRSILIRLDGSYKSIKFQEDIYASFLTRDLTNYFFANFDMLKLKPTNPNFFKQIKYKNTITFFYNLNNSRLQQYKETIKIANELLKVLEKELKD